MRKVAWFSGAVALMVGLGVAQLLTDFDPNEPIGQRPYEMDWANRKEPRPPTITFSNLSGWRMEVSEGAIATFRPSREQNIWNRPVGKLTYRGNGDPKSRPVILLYPPKPIPIPDGSDCVEMWVYGNRWGWENPPDTPPVQIFIRLRNGNGQTERVHLTTVNWKEWWLVHKRFFPVTQKAKTKGWQFEAIEIAGGWQPQDRTIYLDSITFYAEPLLPLKFPQRPKRNLTLFEGQSPGLNVGKGRLDFPTREETILPVNLTKRFRTKVRRYGRTFVFRYKGDDGEVVYRFDPTQGLSGLTVRASGFSPLQIMAGGGVKFADGSTEGNLKRAHLHNGIVTALYENGVTYRLRLWQKSLVLDVICRNEGRSPNAQAIALDFGEIRGVKDYRTVYVPFITYGVGSNPVVLMERRTEDKGRVIFVSVWLDWYRSNGSEPFAFPDGQITPTGVRINGGVRYHPKTDGKRNDVFERVFITVSPNFEEVLPVIPNPKGLHAHLAVDRLWQESWGPGNYEQEMERSRKLRAYGIVKLIQCNHEITWRDGGESFTLRTRAAPGKGGDEALKRYLTHQKSLGWFAGLYTNYTDFAPVNEHWNPDYVQRTPDGNWRPAWPRCYALKPAAAVMFHERLAPVIKGKFHPDGKQISAYTDGHTAASPSYCDYDARVPGAGTFAQTFYCYGELLRNDSRIYGGPIFSEGTYQWLYAGLADGNYALTYNGRPIAKEPLLPVFYLREIHTKECGIGMGWTDWFLQGVPDWQKDVDNAVDRFLLHTIAYGNIGWLVEERFGMERVCRSYYMLQRLQTRYGLLPPKQIAYWDGSKLVSVSEAIARDLPRTRRQLFVAYPNGLQIWLNDWVAGRETGDEGTVVWRVTVNGATYEIPPAGWLAVQGKDFVTFSALWDGHKVDYLRDGGREMRDEPLLYADGRGQLTRFGEVATKGAIAVRRLIAHPSSLEVLDISRTGEFGLQRPLGIKGAPVRCEAFDLDGKPLGEAEIRLTPDYAWVIGKPEGHRYILTFKARSMKPEARNDLGWKVMAETHEAAPGARLPLSIIGAPADAVKLSCQGARLDGMTLVVPEEAAVGTRIWVRAEWKGEVRWWDVTVVPMVIWKATMRPIGDGRAELRLQPRWRLYGLDGKEGTVTLQTPSWLSASQSEWRFDRAKPPTELRAELFTEAEIGMEGSLSVSVQIGKLQSKTSWQLRVAEEPLFLVRLGKDLVSFFWGIARRGQAEQPDDGKSGALFHREESIPVGGVRKDGLFCHPPYIGGVGYTWAQFGPLTLPDEPCCLHAWVGLKDGGYPSDGVMFIVEVVDERGNRHRIAERHGVQKEWRELVADLTKFAGRTVWLRLIADVGPNDNPTADWASWGEPTLRGKESKRRLELRH